MKRPSFGTVEWCPVTPQSFSVSSTINPLAQTQAAPFFEISRSTLSSRGVTPDTTATTRSSTHCLEVCGGTFTVASIAAAAIGSRRQYDDTKLMDGRTHSPRFADQLGSHGRHLRSPTDPGCGRRLASLTALSDTAERRVDPPASHGEAMLKLFMSEDETIHRGPRPRDAPRRTRTKTTEAFADATPRSVPELAQLPNLNTLWATVIVEELVRCNVCNFVICPGSRSTPLVVAMARHGQTRHVVNHDERSGGFYALGWAKAIGQPVAVIVTSGTAVANLLPAAVEAAQAQIPLLLLTADRPAELRDTGANQTITQPGIFGSSARTDVHPEQDMANLQSWGFNVIRLGVMWPGVEPVEGQYNHTYLQVIRQLVDDLYSHGIWTIVDFHQDAFTERYCGEGVPDWLLPKLEPVQRSCVGWLPEVAKIFGQCKSFRDLNYSTDPKTGFPKTSDCLSIGFDQYSRREKAEGESRREGETALKNADGVLGYDLVNEPLNGDYFHDVHLLNPGEADRRLLEPLYASLGEVIHAIDSDAILMYEPAPFPDTLPAYLPLAGGVRPVGFNKGPGSNKTQALSYHIYSKGDLPKPDCPVCDAMASSAVAQRSVDAQRLGGGVFLTEPRCDGHIARVTDRADQAFHSWAYWQFNVPLSTGRLTSVARTEDITTVAGPEEGFYHLNGTLQSSKVAALSRTFAPTIAGAPRTMRFAHATGAFRLRYAARWERVAEVWRSVEVTPRRMHYPRGIQLHVLNGTARQLPNQVEVVADDSGGMVDVALVREHWGPLQGHFQSQGGGTVQWQMTSAATVEFELSAAESVTWWKQLKVISDHGEVLCDLQIQDGQPPARCSIPDSSAHELLFNYSLELWKAKALGIHKRVDVLSSTFCGPLLQRRMVFHWASDEASESEVMI
eukprot:g26120.t1